MSFKGKNILQVLPSKKNITPYPFAPNSAITNSRFSHVVRFLIGDKTKFFLGSDISTKFIRPVQKKSKQVRQDGTRKFLAKFTRIFQVSLLGGVLGRKQDV